jgi:ATP sulfurylase
MTYNKEIGIEILDFKQLVYVASLDEYVTADKVPAGEKPLSISGTKFRAMMNAGEPIPEWFSHPDVIKILRVRTFVVVMERQHTYQLMVVLYKCRRYLRHWINVDSRCSLRD